MLRLVILVSLSFILIKVTTVGWRFTKNRYIHIKKDVQLAEELKSHVYKLSSEIGDRSVFNYGNLQKAETYIAQTFSSFGYDVEFQDYQVAEKTARNIIALKRGENRAQEIVIVGAHYDTCFNPGADDNASAVAGLLELARFMKNEYTNRSIKFIAFVNEEPPFFKTEEMGSNIYVNSAKNKGEDIKAVLILEMLGYYSEKLFSQRYPPFFGPFYPNKANFIAVVGNPHSRWLVKDVVSAFRAHSRFPIESLTTFSFVSGVDFSDHWSFWKEGYPAVMITDTAFYRNPHYHSSQDTFEKLDYYSIAELVKGLSGVLMELAK